MAINGDVPELYYLDDDLDTLAPRPAGHLPRAAGVAAADHGQPRAGQRRRTSSPQQVYFYDQQTKKLTRELNTRPDIKDGDLQPLRPFLLKTRDGLEIPGYYVLPKATRQGSGCRR